ncbi:protein kinase domain-containing protein [Actinomadura rubteroloni]|uniref:protein kinase domain-containing protein n=1 Tax=Actinomadura rubteroloni TaxID=1926885 RepID=UPI00143DCEBA|nr:lipopolysaccharide kinase InaA family protein [Actinomadura rubteroloni]
MSALSGERTPHPRRARRRPRPGDLVRDDRGEDLELSAEIGSGGQGTVWTLAGGQAAVKIVRPEHAMSADRLRARLAVIRRFDLSGIPIARPLSLLVGDHVGYTMELLADLMPIGNLAAVPASGVGDWFHGTGGLRRRLRLLALAAEAFARLHARGIAYGDISPGNVLVSASSDHDQVWLIDPDNLSVETVPGEPSYYTPGYSAPEVVAGTSGPDSLTDVFSFAVLAFQVLTLTHPFVGDLVDQEPERYEADAFSGALPWIDHPDDDRNRSTTGLDRETVLTRGLRSLAGRAFEQGLHDPGARPTMREWQEKLEQAAFLMVACDGCGGTFHAGRAICPWCGRARPVLLRCDAHGYVPPGGIPDVEEEGDTGRLYSVILTPGRPQVLRARDVLLWLDRGPSHAPVDLGEPVAELRWDGGPRVLVRCAGRHHVWVVNRPENRSFELGTGDVRPIDLSEAGRWTVRFGTGREPHRYLTLLVPRMGAR